MVCPTELVQTMGPRLPQDDWASHWLAAQAIEPDLHVPWDDTASIEATRLYARFGYAVEGYMLATDPNATPAHFGRASRITFQEQEVSFANKQDHIYASPTCSYWEQLGSRVRLLRGLLRNGTQAPIMGETIGIINAMTPEAHHHWPKTADSGPEAISELLLDLTCNLSVQKATAVILALNKVLQFALREFDKVSAIRYNTFLESSLLGSAPVGHALLKAFEKDGNITYEDSEQQWLKIHGSSIGQRMVSRINAWAIGKWKVHSSRFEGDMLEAGKLLLAACNDSELELPKFPIRHLRNVLRSAKTRTGLGVDLWLTKLWADLPDDAIKVLLSLIYLVQQGVMPMQLLVVLVSLMPKSGGGERPIALTAMLYRLVMRLNKSHITDWDEAKAGFWDTAIRGSSCLRAALARALQMEVATTQGFAAAGILWDIAAFYDSIRIHDLIRMALGLQFPP